MHSQPPRSSSGFSPRIEMMLEIEGERFSVAEVGPDYLSIRPKRSMPATRASLVISVDGEDVTRDVLLTEGINAAIDRQPMIVVTTSAVTRQHTPTG